MTAPNLDECLARVQDRDSFLKFVKALQLDRTHELAKETTRHSATYGPGANGWENGTIEQFLDAMHAWSLAQLDDEHPLTDEPSWQGFARLLYAGKFYE